jgi:N6-L-threonylcarbamoyladenine synthase
MLGSGFDFSFSGLKTAVRREIANGSASTEDLVASFVAACMDVLTHKLLAAVEHRAPRSAVVVGGVAASPVLRARLQAEMPATVSLVFPSLKFSTDNAAMIGASGWWQFEHRGPTPESFQIRPHLQLATREGQPESYE